MKGGLSDTRHGLDVTEVVGAIKYIERTVPHLVIPEHGLLVVVVAVAHNKNSAAWFSAQDIIHERLPVSPQGGKIKKREDLAHVMSARPVHTRDKGGKTQPVCN